MPHVSPACNFNLMMFYSNTVRNRLKAIGCISQHNLNTEVAYKLNHQALAPKQSNDCFDLPEKKFIYIWQCVLPNEKIGFLRCSVVLCIFLSNTMWSLHRHTVYNDQQNANPVYGQLAGMWCRTRQCDDLTWTLIAHWTLEIQTVSRGLIQYKDVILPV